MVYFGDAKSRNDVEKLQKTQMELLRIAARNQNNVSNAIRSQVKFGESPPTPYVDTLTIEELTTDNYKTTFEAQKKLRELGFNFSDASTIANMIGPDECKLIITNYPSISKMITETFNVKLMTPTVFKEWFDQYVQEWKETKGLSFGNNGKFNNAIIRNISDLKDSIPSLEQLKEISQKIGSNDLNLKNKLDTITEIFIINEINNKNIDPTNSVNGNMEITQILNLVEKLPTKNELDENLYLRGNALFNYLHNKFKNLSESELKKIQVTLTGIDAQTSQHISEKTISELVKLAIDTNSISRILSLKNESKIRIIDYLIQKGNINPRISRDDNSVYLYNYRLPNYFYTLDNDSIKLNINKNVLKNFTDSSLKDILEIWHKTYIQQQQVEKEQQQFKQQMKDNLPHNLTSIERKKFERDERLKNINALIGILDNTPENTEERKKIIRAIEENETHITLLNKELEKTGEGLRKGIKINKAPTYIEFGKHILHFKQLEENVLNMKYKSKGRIPSFPIRSISETFKEFLLDVLENGKVNQRFFEQVPNDERKVFEQMVTLAGLNSVLKIKKSLLKDEHNKELEEFELLKGEYIAGNNNPKIIKELRKYVIKFMNTGKISKPEGYNILMALSE